MSHQNKMLVRRAIDEIWNRAKFDAIEEFVASDFVIHTSTPGEDIHGPEGATQFFGMLHAAFPDIRFTVEDQVADDDRVVTRWVAHGTHTGDFQGVPPTGKTVRLTGIDIDRIANGKVVECWAQSDELGLMKQLGVVPTPEPVGC